MTMADLNQLLFVAVTKAKAIAQTGRQEETAHRTEMGCFDCSEIKRLASEQTSKTAGIFPVPLNQSDGL